MIFYKLLFFACFFFPRKMHLPQVHQNQLVQRSALHEREPPWFVPLLIGGNRADLLWELHRRPRPIRDSLPRRRHEKIPHGSQEQRPCSRHDFFSYRGQEVRPRVPESVRLHATRQLAGRRFLCGRGRAWYFRPGRFRLGVVRLANSAAHATNGVALRNGHVGAGEWRHRRHVGRVGEWALDMISFFVSKGMAWKFYGN